MRVLVRIVTTLGIAAFTAILGGCNSSEAAATKTVPLSSEQIIKRIQDDPHMPPDQKAAAIARVSSHPTPQKRGS